MLGDDPQANDPGRNGACRSEPRGPALFKSEAFRVIAFAFALAVLMTSIVTIIEPAKWSYYGDTIYNVPTARAILSEGTILLDRQQINPDHYGIMRLGGSYVNYFPIGGALVPLPFVALAELVADRDSVIEGIASKAMFFSVVLVFTILSYLMFRSLALSGVLSFLLVFATTNLHILPRNLWTHGSAQLVMIIGLLLIYGGWKLHWSVPSLSAIFFFLGYLSRPPLALLAVLIFFYLLSKDRRSAAAYVGIGAVCSLIFVAWSLQVYASVLPPYYLASRLSLDTFWQGLTGQLFSPNRGLFVFVPLAIISVFGMYRAVRERSDARDLLLIAYVFAFVLVTAAFPHWWGGYSYGPRLYTDVMPLLILFVAQPLRDAFSRRYLARTVVIMIIVLSVSIQLVEVHDTRAAWGWNSHSLTGEPYDVDDFPEHVWDWSDMQMLRFARVDDNAHELST